MIKRLSCLELPFHCYDISSTFESPLTILLQLFQIQSNSNFEFDLLQTFADWQTLKFSKHTILLFKIGFMTVNTEQRMQVLIEKEVKVNE